MTRKRDLSGFGFDAPDPVVAPPPPPPRPAPKPEGPKPAQRKTTAGKKQRITLSLPTRIAADLRRTADREQRIYLDIILAAFVEFADAVDHDVVDARTGPGMALRGSRRRAESGRTQIPLNILREDLSVLDRRREAIGLDRSAYVTELLIRALS